MSVRDLYARLAAAYEAEPVVPCGGGAPGDRYPLIYDPDFRNDMTQDTIRAIDPEEPARTPIEGAPV